MFAHAYEAAGLRDRDGGRYFDRYGFDFCGVVSEKTSGTRRWRRSRMRSAPPALVEKHAARGYKRTTRPTAWRRERPTAEYLAMLEHFDAQVGRMLDRLDELRLTENTVVIFTSDNGGLSRMTSNAPLREGKGSPYEGGIRVPLIVRWPGRVRAGSENATPVHTVDFYRTLMAIAGGDAPRGHHLDGESLMPLLEQRGGWRSTATRPPTR